MEALIIDPQHGLGNRMRALASAVVLSRKLDADCFLRWTSDIHCECELEDLFEHSFQKIDQIPIDWYEKGFIVVNTLDLEMTESASIPFEQLQAERVYVRAQKVLHTTDPYWEEENKVLRSLQVRGDILEKVDAFGDLSKSVGVHIRMAAGAKTHDQACDNPALWSKEGRDAIFRYRKMSHYKNFLPQMDKLIDEDPGQTFFVAADMEQTYSVLSKRYGKRIYRQSRTAYDRSRSQIKEALVDCIALSRCKKILGSYWSSFTELAMRLGGGEVLCSGKDF